VVHLVDPPRVLAERPRHALVGVFASNPLPMWVYDLGTLAFLEVYDAAVAKYGYGRDEFLSMRITDVRPPEDVPALLANVATQRTTLQQSGVWRHRVKSGELNDVEIPSHTLHFAGQPAALVVAQDVTARIRAESAVAEIVLVVEDDEGVWAFVRTVLEARGYRVLAAASPAEAIDVAQHHDGPIHLLFSDVVMPGMSGIELAKRTASINPGLKVLFVSGYTENTIVHTASSTRACRSSRSRSRRMRSPPECAKSWMGNPAVAAV
jgi:PAS domain S-box-containing protein